MKTLLKIAFLFFVFSILFVLPALVLPLQVKVASEGKYNGLMFLLLLLTDLAVIIYLVKRLNLCGWKLFASVVIVFWGLQTFMTQIETWYFREAMPAITDSEMVNLFLRPLITAVTFIPLAIWVLGKWNKNTVSPEPLTPANLTWKRMSILSIVYVAIYFIFGYFVAWQFEEVRVFYTGSPEDAGFIGQLQNASQSKPFISFFQLLRGLLWILMGLPLLMYLKGTRSEKTLACTILYCLPAIQLIVDNPFMPQPVRLAHLLEVSTSNALLGFLVGYVSTMKMHEKTNVPAPRSASAM